VGKVVSIDKGQVAAKVEVEVTEPATVTAVITVEAVDELNIRPGDTIEAVIMAVKVMIAKESSNNLRKEAPRL